MNYLKKLNWCVWRVWLTCCRVYRELVCERDQTTRKQRGDHKMSEVLPNPIPLRTSSRPPLRVGFPETNEFRPTQKRKKDSKTVTFWSFAMIIAYQLCWGRGRHNESIEIFLVWRFGNAFRESRLSTVHSLSTAWSSVACNLIFKMGSDNSSIFV